MPRFDLSAALAARAVVNASAEAIDAGDSQTVTFAVRCNCPACMKGASGGSYSADHVTGDGAAPALTQAAHNAALTPLTDSAASFATEPALDLDGWHIAAAPHDSLFGF